MEETYNLLAQHPVQAERYTLQHYIELTGLAPPDLGEYVTQANDETNNDEDTNDTTEPEDDDDTGYRRTLTDKLVRSFRLHQQQLARHCKHTGARCNSGKSMLATQC